MTSTSDILTVLIDERRQLESIDDIALIRMRESANDAFANRQRVFKNYLLSSDVFYVDHSLN